MILLLICGIVLLPKASCLMCHDCGLVVSASCKINTTCPQHQSQCGSSKLIQFVTHKTGWNSSLEMDVLNCLTPELCDSGSINFGSLKTISITKCCSTDLCNSKPVQAPKFTPNGLKCFTCDDANCKATLNCERDENHCVTATVTQMGVNRTVKGCASAMFCTNGPRFLAGATVPEGSCCQGDYCNSAAVRRAGLLLLVAPLFTCFLSS